MSKKEPKPPCRLCGREWDEDAAWDEYGKLCQGCVRLLDSFSSHQESVVKMLLERIERLETKRTKES